MKARAGNVVIEGIKTSIPPHRAEFWPIRICRREKLTRTSSNACWEQTGNSAYELVLPPLYVDIRRSIAHHLRTWMLPNN